jgi:hypothetical protein
MRPRFRVWSDEGILTPKGRGSGSRIAVAAVLCVVGAIAGGSVYSQIVTDREPADALTSFSARPAEPSQVSEEASVAVPVRTGDADWHSTLQRDVAVDYTLAASAAGIQTLRSPSSPSSLAFADGASAVASSAELAEARPGQTGLPSAKPEEQSRPTKKKSARTGGNGYRSTANDGWNSEPWGSFWGGFSNGARTGRNIHIAHHGPFQW